MPHQLVRATSTVRSRTLEKAIPIFIRKDIVLSLGTPCFRVRRGEVKIVYFHKGFLSPFLFLYKLGAILDFSIIITCDVIGIKTG
jgi:hypothetical protein